MGIFHSTDILDVLYREWIVGAAVGRQDIAMEGVLMVTLIRGAEVFAPEHIGRADVLIEGSRISYVGEVDAGAVGRIPGADVVEAAGLRAVPGFIDPHVHITGGGGEGGFANRTPEIRVESIVSAGVTTVVGCLGTDGVTRTVAGLLAKARGLEAEGISTYIFTGNYQLPVRTITGSVAEDIVFIDKIIGAGEIAVSDQRSFQPSVAALAELVSQCFVGGLLAGKAGVVHFHVGGLDARLEPLHRLVDEHQVAPGAIYATHVARSEALFDDAILLAGKGAFVDITADSGTHDSDTHEWVAKYRARGGDMGQLTLSSDGNGSLPTFDERGKLVGLEIASQMTLYDQVFACASDDAVGLEAALSLVTANTALALKLTHKGRVRPGCDADVLLIDDANELQYVFARGQMLCREGEVLARGIESRAAGVRGDIA